VPLANDLLGSWRLVSRVDLTEAGQRRVDPALGADPIGLLVYDAGGNFAAQFMSRNRTAADAAATGGVNNTSAVGGYDAYFGTYEVDAATGTVTQTLLGALSPANVGMVVARAMAVSEGRLLITLATTRPDGERITRTLTWERASPAP
jgi:hypothetical protein